ncbi:MAG: S41 family peptidase [Pirellulaceae bacterium]
MQTRIDLRSKLLPRCLVMLVLGTFFCRFFLSAKEPPRLLIPAAALPLSAELESVLQRGQLLENSGRWGAALSHYEKAMKSFPGHQDLQQRFHVSQVHCDIARRYSDASFKNSFQRCDEQKAREIYAEVLSKIQTYYVASPNWRQLVKQGTEGFLIALNEPAFVQSHLQKLPAGRRLALRQQIRQRLADRQLNTRYQAQQFVLEIARLAQREIGLRPEACILEYTCGALVDLDLYSSFLTASQLSDVLSQIEGNFVGLGIELKCQPNALQILKVIEGGPAALAGLTSGDRIVNVEGKAVLDLTPEVAADMLRGPEGSQVRVAVVRGDGKTNHFGLQRRRIDVPSVEGVKILVPEDGIAYLKITNFQKNTERSVDAALWQLHRSGMRGLILDLRGNPGGLLNASIDLADKFLSQGLIVSTRGRSAQEDVDYQAHDLGTWKTPLIVLIDRDSASASEIFAGAIHDHRRALVVGERSYGKGSVQGIFPLTASSLGVRLTTAKFFSPSGQPISNRGVTPDVLVQRVAKPQLTVTGPRQVPADPTLDTAVQLLQKEVRPVVQPR